MRPHNFLHCSNFGEWGVGEMRGQQWQCVIRPLAKVLFALLWEKGLIFIGERENTKPFPLSPAPYPQRGPHLPLFPTYARSLLITIMLSAKSELTDLQRFLLSPTSYN
ncbi:hypothetical protein FACHB389_01505 [Nostoc calcicola FACHB-389]|nr:hypothetical protein FACHB389_01505 [Nostoc calcicola FACHB-389]